MMCVRLLAAGVDPADLCWRGVGVCVGLIPAGWRWRRRVAWVDDDVCEASGWCGYSRSVLAGCGSVCRLDSSWVEMAQAGCLSWWMMMCVRLLAAGVDTADLCWRGVGVCVGLIPSGLRWRRQVAWVVDDDVCEASGCWGGYIQRICAGGVCVCWSVCGLDSSWVEMAQASCLGG
jgi:hypothetical protein